MKKYIYILGVALFFNLYSYGQTIYCSYPITENVTDTTLQYLSGLNLNIYKNKPVNDFLAQIPSNYLRLKIAAPGNAKYAEVLSVRYTDNVYIWIYVYKFKYMNPRSETMTWDINLFRKEDIHHIEVWKGVDCYNGCPEGTNN